MIHRALAVGEVEREAAREAAERELSRAAYREARPGPVERALEWLWERFEDLLAAAEAAAPGGLLGLAALLGLLLLVALVVRRRLGPVGRRGALVDPAGDRVLTAADHRRLAEEHAAAGRHAEAVRERVRAVVRELEARGVLEPRAGLTAGEVAATAGVALPALAGELAVAARVFDEVWYGGRPATGAESRRLAEVDERVRSLRPADLGPGGPAPGGPERRHAVPAGARQGP